MEDKTSGWEAVDRGFLRVLTAPSPLISVNNTSFISFNYTMISETLGN